MSSVTQVPHYAAGRSPGPEPAPFGSPTLGQAHAPVSKPPAITIPPSFQNQKTVFAPQAPESQDSGRASPISTEKGSYQSTSSKRAASPKDINAIHYLDRRKGNWRPPLPETDTISSHSVVYPRSPQSASDPEKQCAPRRTNQSDIEHLVSSANPYSTVTFMRDEAPDEAAILKQHVTKILIHLSILSPLLTLLSSIYALVTTVFLILLIPLCYCTSHQPLKYHLSTFLTPPLRYQLRLIHSSYTPSEHLHVLPLLLVSILSPIYAFSIAVAAWVAAFFWFYAAILGDPDGSRDDDGKAAVLGVRRWWERWLIWGLGS